MTAGAAGLVVGCSTTSENAGPAVQTRKRVQWRLASSFPRSLDTLYGASEELAVRVEALSDGAFTIRCYPGGDMIPALGVLDGVQSGTVQAGHTASYYYKGKNPALSFDAGVPFGLTARQQFAWLYHGGGLELMREVFADFNAVNFPGGSTGAQMGGWFRREVPGIADLKGLRMRIPGLGGEVMQRLGVECQVLGGGDIYPALERGAIDATEWVGPYDDAKLGFDKVARYYYAPGWWEPGPTLSFLVNRKAWEELPAEYQRIVEVAAAESSMKMTAKYDSLNPPALRQLIDGGTQVRTFSDEIMAAARDASFALYQEQAASDPGFRKVFEAWERFRQESTAWFAVSEGSFTRFAFQQG
ncbi:ABC transporter substrate-binding protein [Acidobacteria bacterium Mor1]|nr:ABC transporter substrate-binding protein [Acidobacteria bacterium Mor1]